MLKPGSRLRSAVCSAEVIVVRPPKSEVSLSCGGHAMLAQGETAPEGAVFVPDESGSVSVGKRYVDPPSELEVLGAKAGPGRLFADGRPLEIKGAKALPASD
jgi:hypothetical protein